MHWTPDNVSLVHSRREKDALNRVNKGSDETEFGDGQDLICKGKKNICRN